MPTSTNIVVGSPSDVVISAYGVAEGSGVSVGALEGGLKLTYTPEFFYKKADPWLGAVGAVKIGEDLMVEMTLAENSLANLAYALGYPTGAVSGSTLKIGGDDTVTERTIYISGNATGTGTVKITLHKCVIVGAVEVGMVKNDEVKLKLQVKVLQDTTQTADQQMMSVVYSSTDTTPPTIALSTPADGGTVTQGTTGTVTWTITETGNPIDEGTIVYGAGANCSFMILDDTTRASTALVAGTIVYNSATKTVIFTPTVAWTTVHTYQAIVTTRLRDLAGNALATIKIEQFSAT